ncbi:MAG: DUF5372 family protein [Opitutaceae bacterium]
MTHPYHPWRGRRFLLVESERRWGAWRVYYVTAEGLTVYFPAAWTDAGPKDPFVEQAKGRAIARVEDLLALVKMIPAAVKRNTPHA